MKIFIVSFFLLHMLNASDDLDSLLSEYSDESQLFKITKVESAGEVIVFSRHDLDVMQARLLEDVMKSIRGFTMQEDFRGNIALQRSGATCTSSACIRIYIDDHEMSSASSGSALHIFGAYDISHIDHIEVYLGGNDLEFGHEYGFLTLKLYTKEASREQGSQLSVAYGSNRSTDLRAMTTGKVGENLSYLVYASKIDENNDPLKNQGHTLNMQAEKLNIFATLKKENDFTLVLSHYANDHNTPGGFGQNKTADDSSFDSMYQYVSFTKYFDTIKFQASYTQEEKSLYSYDVNAVVLHDGSLINTFNNKFKDTILKASLQDTRKFANNRVTYGVEYQKKSINIMSIMDNIDLTSTITGPNEITIFSAYAEYAYSFTPESLLVATFKYEQYKANSDDISDNLHQLRLGYTHGFLDNFTLKAFASSNEISPSLQELATPPRQIKGNTNLKAMQIKQYSVELSFQKDETSLKTGYRKMYIDDVLQVNPVSKQFVTFDANAVFRDYFVDYEYAFNYDNKIMLEYYWTIHNRPFTGSPESGAYVKFFNTFGKFDIYNELIYREGYYQSRLKQRIANGYDYNVAVTYRMNDSLSFSLKGENVLNKAIKGPIKGLYPIGATDRRVMAMMEYFF